MNRIDFASIYGDMQTYFDEKQSPSFAVPERLLADLNYPHNIFVFGGSSVVISEKKTFAEHLETRFSETKPEIQVINLGINGFDSFGVKRRLHDVLELVNKNPRLVILYMGHNEYNISYTNVINPYFNAFDPFLRIMFRFSDQQFILAPQQYIDTMQLPPGFFWYAMFNRGRILHYLQTIRLFKCKADYEFYLTKCNQLILNHFKNNLNQIIETSQSQNIPLLIVTPIGNLHAEPYGDISKTAKYFRMGQQETDYAKQIEYLTRARDSEFITGDIRAKSELLKHIRTISEPGIYVLDIEQELLKKEFPFDHTCFMDYFHFNDICHHMVADYLYEFVTNLGLLS
jgi:lysophospholipase L1-like esterase